MHVGILPICVLEYAKEIHAALWSQETRKSLAFLRENPRDCRFAVGFALLETAFALALPPVLAAVIDVGIAEMDAGHILLCGLIAVALEALRLVCAVFARRFAAQASAQLAAELRRAIFTHVSRFTTAQISAADVSMLPANIIGDIARLQTGVNDALPRLPRMPVVTVSALIAAFSIDGRCGGVFAATVLVFAFIGAGITLVRIPLARCIRERRDALTRISSVSESGFRSRSDEPHRFRRLSDRICAMQFPLTLLAFGISAAALLKLGDRADLTRGRMAVLPVYLAMTAAAHAGFAGHVFGAAEAGLCGNRIGALLSIKPWKSAPRKPAYAVDEFDRRAASPAAESEMEVPA